MSEKKTLPSISEEAIQARASQQSFTRGNDYFYSNNVLNVVWRDGQLTAEVQGSSWEPYIVQVWFEGDDIHYTHCTCPYDWGGDCKHVIATLLFLVNRPEAIEKRKSIADLLAQLNREQMIDVILDLVGEHPAIIDSLETLTTRQVITESESSSDSSQPPIDAHLLRRQIRAELRTSIQSGYDGWGEERFYDSDLSVALEPALKKARILIDAGDIRAALAVLETAANAWNEGIYDLDDYVIEAFEDIADEFTYPLAELWAEALLSTELTSDERAYWVEALEEYTESMYGGGSLELALTAAQQGWDYPPLVDVLQGNITKKGAWEGEVPPYADFLARIRLQILEKRKQYQEYLYLSQAEGQYMHYLHMLVRQGRVNEALEEAIENLSEPNSIHELARTIAKYGPIEKAFSLAKHGLALEREGGKAALAKWLRDEAQNHQRTDLALWAAQRALREKANLNNYQELHEIAGEEWENLKPSVLETVAASTNAHGKVNIYLYEKMYSQAIATVENAAWFRNIDQVIEAVKTEYPAWAFEQCSKRADEIMDAGRSNDYAVAVNWLRRGRDILLADSKQDRWDTHLSALMETHQRKYKLMPMLEKLRT